MLHPKIKILSVVGARPNFVKIAPFLRELEKHPSFRSVLLHTGQHYAEKLSSSFFAELKIKKPKYNLEVGSLSHAQQTAEVMRLIEPIFIKEKASLIILVGDVNSTLAAGLVAVKLQIPTAHIEAGLRSLKMSMPEEVNRRLVDHISNYLFCTEPIAVKNLRKENIKKGVYLVGNLMIDSLLDKVDCLQNLHPNFNLPFKKYALLTLHRPSNVDDFNTLSKWVNIFQKVSYKIPIIFPIHPRTDLLLKKYKLKEKLRKNGRCLLLEPLTYEQNLKLMQTATLVLTDSGGIQQESTLLNVPCLTLREETELLITCREGSNTLVGQNEKKILLLIDQILLGKYKKFRTPKLWDGRAAERIVEILKNDLCVASMA